MYSIGDKFTLESYSPRTRKITKEKYILAKVAPFSAALISLNSGNRWNNPVEIVFGDTITYAEWENISRGNDGTDKFVKK